MRVPFLILLFLGSFLIAIVSLQSCKKPKFNPSITNEQEIITTLRIEFKDLASGQVLDYYFRDMDGNEALAPSQCDTIKLKSNASYNVSVNFLNESDSNSISNVTHEIKTESKNHLVCIQSSTNSLIIRTDDDGTYPLGLESKWINGPASSGNLRISLMHQPGFKNGSCEIGETDLQVIFPVFVN